MGGRGSFASEQEDIPGGRDPNLHQNNTGGPVPYPMQVGIVLEPPQGKGLPACPMDHSDLWLLYSTGLSSPHDLNQGHTGRRLGVGCGPTPATKLRPPPRAGLPPDCPPPPSSALSPTFPPPRTIPAPAKLEQHTGGLCWCCSINTASCVRTAPEALVSTCFIARVRQYLVSATGLGWPWKEMWVGL